MKPSSKKPSPSPANPKTNPKVEKEKARSDFERGVLARGEAAKRGADGKLPPGATHEVAEGRLVRGRFSIT